MQKINKRLILYYSFFYICLVLFYGSETVFAQDSFNLTCYVCQQQYPNTQIYSYDECEKPNAEDSSLIPLPCNPSEDTCMVLKDYSINS